MNARHAQGEAQRDGDCLAELAMQKIVIQLSQPFPVGVGIGICRLPVAGFPGGVGDGTFGDHADVPLPGQRQGELDRFLIGEADGGLQGIELAAFDGIESVSTVAAVTDVARVTALAGAL